MSDDFDFEDAIDHCERCHRRYLACYLDEDGICRRCREELDHRENHD